jgi:hypothetical protein
MHPISGLETVAPLRHTGVQTALNAPRTDSAREPSAGVRASRVVGLRNQVDCLRMAVSDLKLEMAELVADLRHPAGLGGR